MDEKRRVFSEQEASQILQRAVSLAEESAPGYTPGVTLDELERIASEAGIPADALRKALLEQGGQAPATKARSGVAAQVERVIDGELNPENFDLVLEGLRLRRYRRGGGVEQVGRTLRAQVWSGGHMMEVHLTSRNGRTRLTVRPQVFIGVFFSLYLGFVLSVMGLSIAGSSTFPGFLVVWVVMMAAFALLGAGTLLRSAQPKANELADRLANRVQEAIAETAQTTAPVTIAPSEVSLEQRLQDRA